MKRKRKTPSRAPRGDSRAGPRRRARACSPNAAFTPPASTRSPKRPASAAAPSTTTSPTRKSSSSSSWTAAAPSARRTCARSSPTGGDDIAGTSRQAQLAAQHALDAMTGDPEWRALYLEFLAHAARDTELPARLRASAPTRCAARSRRSWSQRTASGRRRAGDGARAARRRDRRPWRSGCGRTTCCTARAPCRRTCSPRRSALIVDGDRARGRRRSQEGPHDHRPTFRARASPRMYIKAAARAERARRHRAPPPPARRPQWPRRRDRRRARPELPALPADVTEVIAIEPEPTLRAQAGRPPPDAPVPVRVRAGVADALPLGGRRASTPPSPASCSAPSPTRQHALAEIRRVLRPGGELRFYEHVIPRCQPKRTLLQLADHSGAVARDRRRLPPRARHRRRHRGRRLRHRVLERFGFRARARAQRSRTSSVSPPARQSALHTSVRTSCYVRMAPDANPCEQLRARSRQGRTAARDRLPDSERLEDLAARGQGLRRPNPAGTRDRTARRRPSSCVCDLALDSRPRREPRLTSPSSVREPGLA